MTSSDNPLSAALSGQRALAKVTWAACHARAWRGRMLQGRVQPLAHNGMRGQAVQHGTRMRHPK